MANDKGLISKHDAVRHLRGFCIAKYPLSYFYGLFASADEIEKMPTVDAVEVVRCKDCKHWADGVARCTEHVKCCKIGFYMIGEDGYCSFGERRTDG